MEAKETELRQQIAEHPKDDTLWLALGMEYVARDAYEEAVDAFSNGLILNPFNKDCYRERGRKYISLGKYAQAVADFTIASRFDPYDNEHWYYQGVAAYLGEMYDRAIEAFPKAIECMKRQDVQEWVAAVDWLWITYQTTGQKDEAAKVIEMVDEETPVIPRSVSYKRRVMLYKGIIKPEDFIDREALKTTDRPELYLISEFFGLGNYYASIGQEDKAIACWKEARDVPTWHSSFAYQLAAKRLKERGL